MNELYNKINDYKIEFLKGKDIKKVSPAYFVSMLDNNLKGFRYLSHKSGDISAIMDNHLITIDKKLNIRIV